MTWEIEDIHEWDWKKHPAGAVIKDPGNSCRFKTGGWRTFRPIRNDEKCNQCLICYVYCPDSAIIIKNEKIAALDYSFCKGCGICATECPVDAIEMVDEAKALKSNNKR